MAGSSLGWADLICRLPVLSVQDAVPGDQFRRFNFLNQIGVNESWAIRKAHRIPRPSWHVAGGNNFHVLFRRSAFFAIGRGLFVHVGVLVDDEDGFHRQHPLIPPGVGQRAAGPIAQGDCGPSQQKYCWEVREIGFEIEAIVAVFDGS